MGFEIDPLFQKTSQQFDENTNKGLLLNTIDNTAGLNINLTTCDAKGPGEMEVEE